MAHHKQRSLVPSFAITVTLACGTVLSLPTAAHAQVDQTGQDAQPLPTPREQMFDAAVSHILNSQEGEDNAEWPYEGVYRVQRRIPMGYRVGGTSIVIDALINAPNFVNDEASQAAVVRGVNFVTSAIEHPMMEHEFESGYDVRGWGYTYGLNMLLKVRSLTLFSDDESERIDEAIRFYIDGINATSIPQVGGWNYSRRNGFQAAGPPSPFMTGPTLQALFAARAAGFEVRDDIVDAGLSALVRGRTATGSYVYAGANGERSSEAVPGSVGRMLVAESTLYLADRTDLLHVRAAIDAFIVHWEWLDKRRAKTGTHVQPYGVAPYYFYFAHYYAAQAIELLPRKDRLEYRRRLEDLLMRNRLENGTWNDRVFDRSASYGTAMSIMALRMAEINPPEEWVPMSSEGVSEIRTKQGADEAESGDGGSPE